MPPSSGTVAIPPPRFWARYSLSGERFTWQIGRNYVLVQRGTIFTTDIYVPLTAVTTTDSSENSGDWVMGSLANTSRWAMVLRSG